MYQQTPTCWISSDSGFRHTAERVLGHRRGQFGQRAGTDQGTPQSSPTSKSQHLHSSARWIPSFPPHSIALLSDFLPLHRMSRRKRRLPVRRLPCRKPRRWLKSAHCPLPTSPSQREFLSPLPSRSRVFCICFSHVAGIFRAKHSHVSLKKRIQKRKSSKSFGIEGKAVNNPLSPAYVWTLNTSLISLTIVMQYLCYILFKRIIMQSLCTVSPHFIITPV